MKDHPIAFTPAMVSAILAGRKCQTRRIFTGRGPHYQVGDLIWVRETHYRFGIWKQDMDAWEFEGKNRWQFRETIWDVLFDNPHRRPAPPPRYGLPSDVAQRSIPQWYTRPAMFMPMRHARIILQISEVDQQPLQAITFMDAKEEGIASLSKDGKTRKFGIPDRDGLPGRDDEGWPWPEWQNSSLLAYARLWSNLHGSTGPKSWDANPVVSRIVFNVQARPL